MVRLLLAFRSVRMTGEMTSFNPTMVRLLRSELSLSFLDATKVSIPQWCDCCGMPLALRHAYIGFNPTMVRLLLAELALFWAQQPAFQSHNGAIAAITS